MFGTDNYINEHACFGSHNSHYFMLKYVKEFLTAYKGVNRFGYTHITTAHEKSGTIIKTVDKDLREMLEELLKEFSKNPGEDFVLVIAGDHGKHVSETDFVKPGFFENVLPGQIVIANKELIHRLKAHQMLTHSTQRLVSREDWHLTLKHLAVTPYGSISRESNLYNHWKKCTDTEFTVSLLLEMAGNERTCKDLDIEEYLCVCLPFEELSEREREGEQASVLQTMVDFGMRNINAGLNPIYCTQLVLGKIKYAARRQIETEYVIYRIRATDAVHTGVELEIYVALFPVAIQELYQKEDTREMPIMDLQATLRGQVMRIQLLKTLRIDEYVGYMEEFAIAARQKPTFCVPHPPIELKGVSSELGVVFDRLYSTITVRVAQVNNNCFEECLENDSVCQPWALMMLSNPSILAQSWRGNVTYINEDNEILRDYLAIARYEHGDVLGFNNNSLIFPLKPTGCHDTSEGITLICPCK